VVLVASLVDQADSPDKANDNAFSAAQIQSCRDAGAVVSVYEGMYHGFVVRGDFANNEPVRTAADKAMKEIVTFIKESTTTA